jgi:hypothetical protein
MYEETPLEVYDHVEALVRNTLQDNGVPPEQIVERDTCVNAFDAAYDYAKEGDLVVVLSGMIERPAVWNHITAKGTESLTP